MIRSSVDLPEPLGPSSAVSAALGDVERDVVERGEVAELLGDPLRLDPHRAFFLLDPNKVISSNTATEITANSVASAYTLVSTWAPTWSSRW